MIDEEPVVKAYGLVDFKRSTYVKVQTAVLATCVLLTLGAAAVGWGWPAGPLTGIARGLAGLSLVILLLEVGETVVMLRKFREKAAEARG